ncbi:MAG: hypothetical protein K5930_01575, partial [Treponemataceae bacterium]|nr:hypothetical protein [Treponemataceae bacterium]
MKKIIIFLIEVLILSAFISCEYFEGGFQREVTEIVEEKLDIAAINTLSLPVTPKNQDELVCIPSANEQIVPGTIRNPRNYDLGAKYKFTDGSEADPSDISCTIDSSGSLDLVFTQDFLLSRERDKDTRDISGDLILYDKSTNREFPPYQVNLRVNTPPVAPSGAMLQRTGSQDAGSYILCFYMPKFENLSPVHFDTNAIRIKNEKFYFNMENFDGKFYTSQDMTAEAEAFSIIAPDDLSPMVDNGAEFIENGNFFSIYYDTNTSVTRDIKRWSITLEDDEGLTSDIINTSNNILSDTRFDTNIEGGSTYWTDDDGYLVIKTFHDGKYRDGTSAVQPEFLFKVLDANNNEIPETSTRWHAEAVQWSAADSAYCSELKLQSGIYNRIEAYVRAGGSVSPVVSLLNITVKQPTEFYVNSSTGNDNYGGTRNYPLRTIQQAVTNFCNGFEDEPSCRIILMTDINVNDTASNPIVTIPSNTRKTFTITSGDDSNRTIDGRNAKAVITAQNGSTLNLRNLTIKGGSSDVYGSGIRIESGARVKLTSCTVAENRSSIYIGPNAELTLDGNISIPEASNKANYIYMADSCKPISIGSDFSWSGEDAIIKRDSYTAGTRVLTGSIDTIYDKFKLDKACFSVGSEGIIEFAPDLYVDSSSGSDSIGNGSSQKPYATVSKALEAIKSINSVDTNYIIHISGTINDQILLTTGSEGTLGLFSGSTLTIRGTDKSSDKLDGSDKAYLFKIECPNTIILDNISICNLESSSFAAVHANDSRAVVDIRNCIITNNSRSIYIKSGAQLSLDGAISIPAGNNGSNFLHLEDVSQPLVIESSFSWTGENGLLKLGTYTNDSTVLTGSADKIATASSKLMLDNTIYSIQEDGKIHINPNFYVDSSSGNDSTGNGSSQQPYATVSKVLNTIKNLNIARTNYVIHVSGIINDQILLTTGATGTLGAFT